MQKLKLQPKNWQKVKLGEFLSVSGGGTPSTRNSQYWNGEIPWLTPAEVSGFFSRFIERTNRNISEKGLGHSSAKLMPAGSLLFTSRANIGDVVINKVPMATNQGFINIAPSKEVDQMFLFYWLKRNYHYFNQIAVGSTFPELTKSVFKEIIIELPELADQKHIVDILSSFDDKIELNNKINQNLEQIAQAIFKEWFVEFKFPGYKKAKMINSELGKTPEGWRVKKIKDVVRIKKGLSYSSKEINEKSEGLPLINLANFQRGGGYNSAGIKFYTGGYSENHVVRPGDIVIAMTDLTSNREVIGHPARVPVNSWNKILISLDVCALEIDDLHKEYLYYLMLRKDFAYQMASSAGGTNVAHLSKSAIEEFEFILPASTVLEQFKNFINNIFQKQNVVEVENQKLTSLRDLLLPKLISGEIRTK